MKNPTPKILSELDQYEFAGINDIVKQQTLRDLVIENEQLESALRGIVRDFECDFMLDGVIVDHPSTLMVMMYNRARAVLRTND